VFDIEELSTHGGSLRIYGCHLDDPRATSPAVSQMIEREIAFGLQDLRVYLEFQLKANKVKNDFITFLMAQKLAGKSIGAYGAAAKGNTLMNYAGIKTKMIDFVCDAAPSKQGKFMPGSHIPILHPEELFKRKPDWVVIFPWNIAEEVTQQHQQVRSWGGQFVISVPELRVLS
jgi:hypothetical protein